MFECGGVGSVAASVDVYAPVDESYALADMLHASDANRCTEPSTTDP